MLNPLSWLRKRRWEKKVAKFPKESCRECASCHLEIFPGELVGQTVKGQLAHFGMHPHPLTGAVQHCSVGKKLGFWDGTKIVDPIPSIVHNATQTRGTIVGTIDGKGVRMKRIPDV